MPKISLERLESRREHILEAASHCFAREGFHHTTIADIIRESQMSNGSVFLYFKTKDDLLTAVIRRTVSHMAQRFRELTQDCDEPAQAVLICIRAMSKLMSDPATSDVVHLFPQIFSELGRNPELREQTAELFGDITVHFVGIVRAAKQKGLIDRSSPDVGTANVMVSLFQGYIIQRLNFGSHFNERQYLASVRGLLGANKCFLAERG